MWLLEMSLALEDTGSRVQWRLQCLQHSLKMVQEKEGEGRGEEREEQREEERKRKREEGKRSEFVYGVREGKGRRRQGEEKGAHTNVPRSYKTDESIVYDSIYMKHPKLANLQKQEADGWFPRVWVRGDQG